MTPLLASSSGHLGWTMVTALTALACHALDEYRVEGSLSPAEASSSEAGSGATVRSSEQGGAGGAGGAAAGASGVAGAVNDGSASFRDAGSGSEGQSNVGTDAGTRPTGGSGGQGTGAPGEQPPFAMRVLASELAAPWEITWGPDDLLWVTEREGRRILRVRAADGSVASAFTIDEVLQTSGQDGLLGLALHPGLLSDANSRFVYLAYTYDADPGKGVDRRAKLRRFTFDPTLEALGEPFDVLAGLPASDDHNSGRLAFGPDARLYYTVGDLGSNQFSTVCNPNRAQELPSADELAASDYTKYAGKILRLELDGSVPADNPVFGGTRSHVYSYGHRNAQGLVFAGGRLYADEHGPKSDDELNLILAGGNYGWPYVSGHHDGQAYAYANWSASDPTPCSELEYSDYVIPESVPISLETDFAASAFLAPLATFYTVPSDYLFQDPACPFNDYICWPTIAPSSLDFYPAGGLLTTWANSLLLSSLKHGALFRAQLSADGLSVIGAAEPVLKTRNRYRDLAVKPGGAVIYVVTDSAGAMVGPEGGVATETEQPGSILEFTLGR